MARRPYWKGFLKLSLVSYPIALYPASSSTERVSFRLLNKKTGNRLKQQLIDAESKEPVEKDDIVRGCAVDKNEHIVVDDEELEKIEIEALTRSTSIALPLEPRWRRYIDLDSASSWATRAKRAIKYCEILITNSA
jgi:non-homologous end joining protein Ku